MLEELKCVELELLKAFIKVCDELKLNYYVIDGTLLGAVRHKGFIPWDDDIDVGMPREDYEIFLKKGQELLPEYYFLQNIYTDREYLMSFSKIRDSRTTFIETSVKDRRINHGVFIDIFPLDFSTNEAKLKASFRYLKRTLDFRIGAEFYVSDRSWKVKLVGLFLKMRYPSIQKALLKREKLFCSMNQGAFLANHSSAWGIKEIVPVEWYGEGADLEFEGIAVKGPVEYDKVLTQIYGDYMQLPPEEKRIAHHYTEVIDLKKPYVCYMKLSGNQQTDNKGK